ncbi:MAG: Uma2 family endonuclease [Acidobacteriota bacterium]
MGLAKPQTYYYSPEEYLKSERKADERSEFIDGEIYAMAGESGRHGDISMNLAGIVQTQLRGIKCRGRVKDTKVKSGALKERFGKGMISYPDLVVICGEPEYHDKHQDVVLNPAVIIEVLSESTEEFDRGVKFMRYRNFNETLTDYILVSQTEPHVEHFIRQENGDWLLKEYYDLDASFQIDSINCSLDLAEIYERVEFE